MSMPQEEIFAELMKLVDANNLAGIREFLIAHVNEIPEEVRDDVIFNLARLAIQEETEDLEALNAFKKELVDNIKFIDGVEGEMENQDRIGELQKQLGIPRDSA